MTPTIEDLYRVEDWRSCWRCTLEGVLHDGSCEDTIDRLRFLVDELRSPS